MPQLFNVAAFAITQSSPTAIGNESVPIQLAQCRFPGLAISSAKILVYFFNKIYGSNFTKQHSETVIVRKYQNADCSLTKICYCVIVPIRQSADGAADLRQVAMIDCRRLSVPRTSMHDGGAVGRVLPSAESVRVYALSNSTDGTNVSGKTGRTDRQTDRRTDIRPMHAPVAVLRWGRGTAPPPQSWLAPHRKFAVLLTHCGQLGYFSEILGVLHLMPSDVKL